MTNRRGNSWEGSAVKDGKRARRSFKTQLQAEAFERYPLSSDRTVEQEFRIAFDILWRGAAKDERGIYRTIELLIDAVGRKRFIWSIDTNDIHNLVLVWKKNKNTGGTINRKLCALRMVLKNCHARKMIPEMPAFPNKMAERPSRDGFLSLDQADRLIANLRHETHRALALFLLHTGCRIGEALKISWEHISDQNHLTLISENTKTQRTRVIGFGPRKTAWERRRTKNRIRYECESSRVDRFRNRARATFRHVAEVCAGGAAYPTAFRELPRETQTRG